MTTDIPPTGGLLVTSIFLGAVSSRACSGACKCCTGMAQSQGQHTLWGNSSYSCHLPGMLLLACLVGLVGFDGWKAGLVVGLVGWLVNWLVGWFVGGFVSWVHWLGGLVGWSVGWVSGSVDGMVGLVIP